MTTRADPAAAELEGSWRRPPSYAPLSPAAAARLQLALWCFQCALAQAASQYLQPESQARGAAHCLPGGALPGLGMGA